MARKIEIESMIDRVFNRLKAGNKTLFADVFNSQRTTGPWEAEELISSIERGIGQMVGNINELKDAYENFRKEYPDLLD